MLIALNAHVYVCLVLYLANIIIHNDESMLHWLMNDTQ